MNDYYTTDEDEILFGMLIVGIIFVFLLVMVAVVNGVDPKFTEDELKVQVEKLVEEDISKAKLHAEIRGFVDAMASIRQSDLTPTVTATGETVYKITARTPKMVGTKIGWDYVLYDEISNTFKIMWMVFDIQIGEEVGFSITPNLEHVRSTK